jgi:quercetin dioxygenase-like cupin family protein
VGQARKAAQGGKVVEAGISYVAPGRDRSVWIGDRELVTFKEMGKDTGGQFALVEVVGLAGSGPPPHIHHSVDEVYCLLEGELEVLDGDSTFMARAGSVFHIPKGTLHAWRNATTEPARTLLFISPAGFEGFFEEAGIPGTDHSSPPPPPTHEDLQRMVELGRKYDTEYPPVPGW